MRNLNQISTIVLKWTLTLAAVAGVVLGAIAVHQRTAAEHAGDAGEAKPPSLIDSAGGIKLAIKQVQANNIEVEEATAFDWVPRVPVYGRVVPNPHATVEIRAPFAGRLTVAKGSEWPRLANPVKAASHFGQLEIRVGSQDRLDLQAKLSEAKLKHEGADTVRKIQQDKMNRFQLAPSSFARGDLDSALVALAEAQTQLAVTKAAVELYEGALTALEQKLTTWIVPVIIPADGEITELVAWPETLVEAGGLIAKVVNFRKPLVRIDIPLNLLATAHEMLKLHVLPPTPPALEGPTNQIELPAYSETVAAKLLGVSPQLDPALQAAGYLYEVHETKSVSPAALATKLWRPGLFVKAELELKAKTQEYVIKLPKTAVFYFQGRALVYREKQDPPPKFRIFIREEVRLLGREGDFVVLTGITAVSLTPGDRVVTRGAQTLLSLEFRTDTDD